MTTHRWEAAAVDAVQQSPEWFGHGADDGASLQFLSSESIPGTHTDQPALVSEVAFDSDTLLYLASAGPDANCHRLVVDDVTIAADEITIEAHVDCASGMAAQTITHPASVLWIPDVAADHASAAIVDGWDQSHTVSATVDTG